MKQDRISFKIGDLFDRSDPVDRWITVACLAWNDLALANQRLLRGLKKRAPPHENLRDSRVVAAWVWELSDFLREAEGKEPQVAAAIQALPAQAQADYRTALAPTDPAGPNTWFKNKLRDARHKASHYPRLNRKELATAMGKLADEQGEIVLGRRFIDLQAGFADDVAVNLFFASDPKRWEEEFKRFATELREVVLAFMRFLQEALQAHLGKHRDDWTAHRSWRSLARRSLRRLFRRQGL